MADVLDTVIDGLRNAGLMAYEVWWALVLGFTLSAIVQAWVPRSAIERSMSGEGFGPVARATAWGAASSSCSYAAIAIAKSLFQKGASTVSALAFQFASTNLVWELGLILWLLMGWEFAAAEFVGGIILILLMWVFVRVFVSKAAEAQARAHAAGVGAGAHDHHDHDHHAHAEHDHHGHGEEPATPIVQHLVSRDSWRDVAQRFVGVWLMLWKEIGIGFLIAGYVSLLPVDVFNALFITDTDGWLRTLENALVGPVIAALTFVCSIGNVPLAAVLWSNGMSFAGVISFIFADLIVLPILLIYRKYYGGSFALRITGLMYMTMVAAGLLVAWIFDVAGIEPHTHIDPHDMFAAIELDYRLVLNVIAGAAFVLLAWLGRSRPKDHCCH